MDDLAERINSVLSDPESVRQLGEIAKMLGFPPPDENSPPIQAEAPQGVNPAALAELMSKLREAGGDDDNINFLNALRPLLSEEKRPRIDRAIKLLKLINLLPVLKDSGLLGGDLLGIL